MFLGHTLLGTCVDHIRIRVHEWQISIRVVGILIFMFVGIDCLGRLAMSGYADAMVVASGFNLDGRININGSMVVVAIGMLVLSEVFRHGSNLREENSLTV